MRERRLFFKSVIFIFIQFLISCVYRKIEKPANPTPPNIGPETPEFSDQAFISELENELFISGDIIELIFDNPSRESFDLSYSPDNGKTWTFQKQAIKEEMVMWDVPLEPGSECLLKITSTRTEIISKKFSVIASTIVLPDQHIELATPGGYKIFENIIPEPFVLVNSNGSYKLLSLVCTHNGCTAQYSNTRAFYCSFHGSAFDHDGKVTQGPALRDLPVIRHKVTSDKSKILLF